jgi:hypothetical protein
LDKDSKMSVLQPRFKTARTTRVNAWAETDYESGTDDVVVIERVVTAGGAPRGYNAVRRVSIEAAGERLLRRPSTRNDHEFRKTGPFSKRETNAIVEGVQRFGVGNWSKIRDNDYEGRLDGRTGVQIKDKYQNMLNSGRI